MFFVSSRATIGHFIEHFLAKPVLVLTGLRYPLPSVVGIYLFLLCNTKSGRPGDLVVTLEYY